MNKLVSIRALSKGKAGIREAGAGARRLHSSPVPRSDPHDHGGYLHASKMYDLSKVSKPKVAFWITTGVVSGLGLPFFAVWFSQKKAGLL